VVLTVTAVVLVLVLPGLFERAAAVTWGRLGLTFLIGLVSSIVVPVVLVLLMATAIGIPLALMAGLMWLLAVLLSGPFTAYLLGRRILRRSNPLLVMLVGAAVVFLLYLLPFVGWLFWLIGMWVGLGALLMLARDMRRSRNEPKTKQTDVPPAAKASGKTTRAAVKA
jgi:MFS superfamily sulfate permease-like transporter